MNRFEEILYQFWGYKQFRPMQLDIVQSVADGHDTLGLLPTGGGKSITFQVPAMAQEGVCLVVTPLIALMLDQVEQLRRRGIAAEAIYSGLTPREIEIIFNRAAARQLKFIYLSPERLKTPAFKQQITGIHINLIAVDEAHCISQWGYDFRPPYLEIADIRTFLPDVPVIALTASATPDVVKDIQERLHFPKENVFRKSFFRDNLVYISRMVEDKQHYLLQTIRRVQGTGIVYVRNRKKTYEIAKFLAENGISADYYHAGLSQDDRKRKQADWQNNKIRIIVSTNAFGMGIDKPDVRLVLHMDLPDSLEAYYQEAGRGGRDGAIAYAGIIYNQEDILKLEASIELSFPHFDEIKRVYSALGNYLQIPFGAGVDAEFEFDFSKFASHYQFNPIIALSAIRILEKEGWIQMVEPIDSPSRIHFLVTNNDLYRFYISNPDFETFIRLLLRSYQGLFTGYIHINEHHIAQKASIKVETVVKYLKLLQTHGLISYLPRKNSAYMVYLQERMDEKYIHISGENYQQRKSLMTQKIAAMKQLVLSEDRCRSAIILEYFGEKDAQDCGMCDVCMERKTHQEKITNLELKILQNLALSPASRDQLAIALRTNAKLVMEATERLMDEQKIILNEDFLFEIKQ